MDKKSNKISAVYLLPNLVTLGAMFCGFYSIILAINELFTQAAVFILFSMILDGLDGRVARLTNTQTSFGEYFDSLSDLLCFGVAPALLIYLSSLSIYTSGYLVKISYLVCFIYVASTAIRLARFNSRNQTADKKYFIGLADENYRSMYIQLTRASMQATIYTVNKVKLLNGLEDARRQLQADKISAYDSLMERLRAGLPIGIILIRILAVSNKMIEIIS